MRIEFVQTRRTPILNLLAAWQGNHEGYGYQILHSQSHQFIATINCRHNSGLRRMLYMDHIPTLEEAKQVIHRHFARIARKRKERSNAKEKRIRKASRAARRAKYLNN